MIDVVWIKNQDGEEIPWKVEQERPSMFEVFYKFGVTHIDKSLVRLVNDSGGDRWEYPKVINIPKDVDDPARNFFVL